MHPQDPRSKPSAKVDEPESDDDMPELEEVSTPQKAPLLLNSAVENWPAANGTKSGAWHASLTHGLRFQEEEPIEEDEVYPVDEGVVAEADADVSPKQVSRLKTRNYRPETLNPDLPPERVGRREITDQKPDVLRQLLNPAP